MIIKKGSSVILNNYTTLKTRIHYKQGSVIFNDYFIL